MVERRPKFGFCSMARFRRVANPFGRWRPVVPASDCGLLRQVGLEDHTRVYLMEVASEKGSRQGHYRRQVNWALRWSRHCRKHYDPRADNEKQK